jgi:predicted component of type VI protein secretion system
MKAEKIFKRIEKVVNDARSSTEESEALLSSVLDDIDALLDQRENLNVKDKAED